MGRIARALVGEPPGVWRLSGESVFLAGAAVIQWIAVALLAVSATHNGWLYFQGGDESFFYSIAWIVSHGHLPDTGIGYAWSLVEAPIAAVAGPSFFVALPAIVVLQVVVFLPLGLVALYGSTKRLLGAAVARLAVVAWIAAPYAVIPLFVARYHERWVDQTLPQVLGLTGMGDFASMVLLLCAAYLVFRHLDEGGWETAALAGLVTGFALGLKPSNSLFLAGPAIALLLARRGRGAVSFGLAIAPALVALAVWKQRGLGTLPLFASGSTQLAAGVQVAVDHVAAIDLHRYVRFDWAHLQNNADGIREYFWSNRLVEWVPLAGALGAFRRSPPKAALLVGWLAAFVLIKGSDVRASVDSASFWRLLAPAWPAYFLLAVSLLALVPTVGTRLRPAPAAPARSLRRELWVAGVLLAALPLVVVSVLPRDYRHRAARDNSRNLLVPFDGSFRVDARAGAGRAVTLAWRGPAAGGARTTYIVLRAPAGSASADGVACTPRAGGVPGCAIAMTELGYAPAQRFVDHPGSGRWVYRVAQAASYTADPNGGDPLLYSAPVTVSVS